MKMGGRLQRRYVSPSSLTHSCMCVWQDERDTHPPTAGQSKAIKLHLQHLSEALEENGWATTEEVRFWFDPSSFPPSFCCVCVCVLVVIYLLSPLSSISV